MEYCSACKSILRPEYTFCPFCGAKIPGRVDAEREFPMNEGEILLFAEPDKKDAVVYRAWDLFVEKLKDENKLSDAPSIDPKDPGKVPEDPEGPIGTGSDKEPVHGKEHEEAEEKPIPDSSPEEIAKARQGDTVYIGGKPWHVLWVRGDSSLLVAGKPVGQMAFTESSSQVSWRTSKLRKWLDKEFVKEFFTPEQRKNLKTVKNSTTIRRGDGYDFIESTEERVTILSRKEYEFYVGRIRDESWTLYNDPGMIRDLSSNTSGGGTVTTLQVKDGKEKWGEENTSCKLNVFPRIWWRTT